MSAVRHRFPHDLPLPLARRATQRAVQAYVERFAKFQPQIQWHDEDRSTVEFKATGLTFRGRFELTQDAVLLSLEVPFLLRALRPKAIEIVGREIEHWVRKVREEAGED